MKTRVCHLGVSATVSRGVPTRALTRTVRRRTVSVENTKNVYYNVMKYYTKTVYLCDVQYYIRLYQGCV